VAATPCGGLPGEPRCPSGKAASWLASTATMCVTETLEWAGLAHVQQGLPKAAKSSGLSFEAVDLGVNSRRQHRGGSIPPEAPQFMFQVLLCLRGDIPDLLFALEGGDEVPRCGHRVITWGSTSNVIPSSDDPRDGAERPPARSIPWQPCCRYSP
jgi:hypothetical protein